MKYHSPITLLLLLLACSLPASAQKDKEERKEEQTERKAANQDKVDINVFRRQILTLPQYAELRRKLPQMKKNGQPAPRILAFVDSSLDAEPNLLLTGFIQLVQPGNTINVYEVTYDRKQKKIVAVKPTGELTEEAEDNETEAAPKKTAKSAKKAAKEQDEEEDEADEPTKPAPKSKKKTTEDDDE